MAGASGYRSGLGDSAAAPRRSSCARDSDARSLDRPRCGWSRRAYGNCEALACLGLAKIGGYRGGGGALESPLDFDWLPLQAEAREDGACIEFGDCLVLGVVDGVVVGPRVGEGR